MSKLIKTDTSYAEWIKSVSLRFRQSQIKAAVKVNSELIRFYWELGRDIVEMKAEERWTENFWENLSRDLQTYLPGVKGFSITNLQYTRLWKATASRWAFQNTSFQNSTLPSSKAHCQALKKLNGN